MTFVGALVLGLLESYAIGYIDGGQQYFSTVRFAIAPIVLAIVLLTLPSAQLRHAHGRRLQGGHPADLLDRRPQHGRSHHRWRGGARRTS